jgi:hypothetical protein
MDTNLHTKWSYNIDDNILAIIHNALTKMLNDFMMATEMANVKVKYKELHMWHVEYLKKYWYFFELVVKQHHDNIHEVVSSWMSEKVTLSTVQAAEQEHIIQNISEIKNLVDSLSVDNVGLTIEFDCIIQHLNHLKSLFVQHFATREDGMLTTIHKCFSQPEFKTIQDKLLVSFQPLGYGWFLYGLNTNRKRNKWLKNVAEVSVFKRWTMLTNDYQKFDKHTRKLLTDIMTSH